MPMHIAVVTETYLPEVNGVARTMGQLLGGLLARGHQIELIRPVQPADRAVMLAPLQPGITQHLVRGLAIPRYGELQMGLASPASLVSRWRVTRPDVVHVVTEGPLGWAAVIAARRLGIPLSSGFHTNFHAYSRHYGIGVFAGAVATMLRALHNRCAATIVPTDELRRALAARGFERLFVVGRGIDTALFNPGRRSPELRAGWGCKNDEPVVIHVGRLAPEKNLGLFINAARAMQAVDSATRVVLVGDGPDAAALRAAHPDFVFAGTRKGPDLAAHYASADLFLFPSETETFGNVLTEALASGLASVAYDYAAARQHVVHGESGLLVPFGDAHAFVAAARRLAGAPHTATWLKRNARAVGLRLRWDRIVDDLERVLSGVAAQAAVSSAKRLPGAVQLSN
jgi:glycosyltransferase involved in cell wall biosynthesis